MDPVCICGFKFCTQKKMLKEEKTNSDSRERLAAVVDSGAESRNGGVQRTISQTTTDALAKRFKVTK